MPVVFIGLPVPTEEGREERTKGANMLIAGLRKTSFLDYPGQPCAVVFTPHCNMNCTYCHNAEILRGSVPLIPEQEVLEYLEKRAGTLQAVTISGGEPTIQQDLVPFCERLRAMGYMVKLDTNGLKPAVMQELLLRGLVDYVAMDIKASPEKYDAVARVHCDMDAIRRSIYLLQHSGVQHEFRTTFAPELTTEDILGAVQLVDERTDNLRYYLQQYRPRSEADAPAHLPSYVQEAAERVRQVIGACEVRGL